MCCGYLECEKDVASEVSAAISNAYGMDGHVLLWDGGLAIYRDGESNTDA